MTQLRDSSLTPIVERLNRLSLDRIIIVVNIEGFVSRREVGKFIVIHSGENRGGAGGFAFGLREALELKPDWIWTCDDDAIPEKESIVDEMNSIANDHSLDLLAPLIVSPSDNLRLSFPFRNGMRRVWDRNQIEQLSFVNGQAHLFNGTLFKTSVIESVGLPDPRLFIRGDEQEYLFRIIKSGYKVGTTTKVAMVHPSGEDELYPTCFGMLRTPIPHSALKLSYQIRNRGFLTRKYRRWDWLIVDAIRYSSFFLLRKKPRFRALVTITSLYLYGAQGKINTECPVLTQENWDSIQKMISSNN